MRCGGRRITRSNHLANSKPQKAKGLRSNRTRREGSGNGDLLKDEISTTKSFDYSKNRITREFTTCHPSSFPLN
jgi:hypothetical protein